MLQQAISRTHGPHAQIPPPRLGDTRLGACPDLTDEERAALNGAATSVRTISSGRDVIREGDQPDRLSFVIEGWACRFKASGEGTRQIVGLAVPGDAANLEALLFGRSCYGVRTLTQAVFVSLSRQQAWQLAAQHPGIARAFTWLSLVDHDGLAQWALCLGRHSASQRLAHLLCELSVRLGAEADNSASFALPITQEHIADMLGLTAVHVNRTFHRLRSLGLVATEHRTVTIPDLAGLRRLGDFDPAYLHRA